MHEFMKRAVISAVLVLSLSPSFAQQKQSQLQKQSQQQRQPSGVLTVRLPAGRPVAVAQGNPETLDVLADGTVEWKSLIGDWVRFSMPLAAGTNPFSYDLVRFDVKLEGGISEVMAYVDTPGKDSWIYRPIDITNYGDAWMPMYLDLHLAEFILPVSHSVKSPQITFQIRAIDGERPDQKSWRCVKIRNVRFVKTPIHADWNETEYTVTNRDSLQYVYPVKVKNLTDAPQTVVPRIEAVEAVWGSGNVLPKEVVIAPHDSTIFAVVTKLPKKAVDTVPVLYCESFQPYFMVKGKPETEVTVIRSTDLIRFVVIKPPNKPLPLVYTTREKLERARRWAGTTDWGRKQKEEIVKAAEAVLKQSPRIPDIGGFANAYYYCVEHRTRLVYEGPGRHKCPVGGEYLKKDFMGVDLDLDYTNNVHVNIIRSTFTLAKAYALTGDDRFAAQAKFIFNGYRDKYFTYKPMDLDGQTQTIDKGRTVFAKYMESFNFGDFFMAYDLLKGCGVFSPQEVRKLERELFIPIALEMQDYRMEMSHRQENISRCAFFMGVTTGHPALLAFGASSLYGITALNRYAAGADGYPLENNEGYHFAFINTVDEYAQVFENIGIPMFDASLKRHAEGTYRYSTTQPGKTVPDLGTLYALHYPDPLFRDHAGDDLFLGQVNHPEPSKPFEFPNESVNFPFSGHTVLKRPDANANLGVDLNWGSPSQRGEFELLSPTFYAFGSIIPGEPGQFDWGSTDRHHDWQIMSASHSTLVVDMHNQSGMKEADYLKGSYGPHPSRQLYYSDQEGMPATVVYNDRIYPGVRIWRGLAVIDGAFVMMDRLESDTPHTYDWFFYGVPDKGDGLSGIKLDMKKRTSPLGETDGYQIPENLSEAVTSGDVRADWTWNPGDAAKSFALSLTMPNKEPVRAVHGFTLWPAYSGKEKEFLVLRRENAKDSGFMAVFEPHKGASTITGISAVPVEEQTPMGDWRLSERASAVLVGTTGGVYELVLNPTGGPVRTPNQTVWEAWGSVRVQQ